MFAKETYMQRRALLKKNLGSGVLLFLGNDECGLNYEDNTFRYRQDSTFLYYFGLSCAGLSAIIDIDEDKEIIFGDELSIDAIVWMGSQPTLHEKCERVGVKNLMPSAEITSYLHKCVQKGKAVHYLPPYRPEHKLKLMDWLGVPLARQEGSVPFIRAVVAQRNYKSAEEIAEIEKACDVTADMHITAMKVLRPGMYEYEVVAEMNRIAQMNNCELSFATIATINGQTLHNHYHGNKVKPGDLFLIDAGASFLRVTVATCRPPCRRTRPLLPASVPFTKSRTPSLGVCQSPPSGHSLYEGVRAFRPSDGGRAERAGVDEGQCRRCRARRGACLVLSPWTGSYDGVGCARYGEPG